jgi:hypothetical protein
MASIINATTTAGVTVTGDNSGSLQLATNNGTTAVTIDTSQNVGIGLTPPVGSGNYRILNVGATVVYGNTGLAVAALNNNADINDKYVITGVASSYTQSSGNHLWYNAVSGSAGASISFTERMRIDSSGNVLVGSSSNILSAKFLAQYNGSTQNGAVINDSNNTSASGFMAFSVSSGTYCGNITRVGSTSAVGYNSGSDARFKENIVDAPTSNINEIKVRSFNWKSDNTYQKYGLIAQELLESAPYSVYQPTNPNDMMGVDNSKLVPMMIKAIQELNAKVDAQAVRIAELEGAR